MACGGTTESCWIIRDFRAFRVDLIEKVCADSPDAGVFSPVSLQAMGIPAEAVEHVLHWAISGAMVITDHDEDEAPRIAWVLIGALAFGAQCAKRGLL